MCCLNSGQGTAVLCSWVSDRTFFFFYVIPSVFVLFRPCTNPLTHFVVTQWSLLCSQSYF